MTRLLPLAPLLAAACAPAVLQTARTNGRGNAQFAVEPGVWVGENADGESVTYPTFNVSGRYGVTDGVDLGLRLGTSLYEVQAKVLLTDPAEVDRVALALAPSTTFVAGGLSELGASVGGLFWHTRVPLLIGVPVGGSELTVGPRLSPLLVGVGAASPTGASGSATAFVLMAGASVGFAGRAADRFRVLPEVGFDVPVVSGAAVRANGTQAGSASIPYERAVLQVGVGFLFGGPDA